jgi:uncharacterized protein YbjT (DUF2867 family)
MENKGSKAKVLLVGAGGALGSEIGKQLQKMGYFVRGLCLNAQEQKEAESYTDEQRIGNAAEADQIYGIAEGMDIVCSALGNSLNIFDTSSDGFQKVDVLGNANVLTEALKANVKRFVYVSMYDAEKNQYAEVPRVHHQFAERVRHSGLSYTIVQPVGLFTGFMNLVKLAQKTKILPQLGDGHWKTNPIHPADLGQLIAENIEDGPEELPAGGPEVYTRAEINEMIIKLAVPEATLVAVPRWLASLGMLPFPLLATTLYDKLEFFYKVSTQPEVAPKLGKKTLPEWLKSIHS